MGLQLILNVGMACLLGVYVLGIGIAAVHVTKHACRICVECIVREIV
jgi:hypothetical protein